LDCSISRRGIALQLRASILNKLIILKPIYLNTFSLGTLIVNPACKRRFNTQKGKQSMTQKKRGYSRRDFMKAAGTAGLGSALFSLGDSSPCRASPSSEQPEHAKVPKRPFGKTGIDVSVLALGGVLKMSDLLVFRQAFKMGVTYWDTADSYKWGNNEQAIGKYFTKFPQDRKKVFLVTKSATSDPQKLTE
jgi:hypothetical protein